MRKVLLNAVGGFRAGDVFDPDQGQQRQIDAAASIGGKFVDATGDAVGAAVMAAAAYARGDAGAASGIMLAQAAGTGGSGGGGIGWSPLGHGNAITFADMAALVAASPTPPLVYLVDGTAPEPPASYPITGILDMRGGSFMSVEPPQDTRIVTFADGAVVKNLGAGLFAQFSFSGGMKVQFTSTGGVAPLQWDAPMTGGPWFLSVSGGLLENLGSTPVVKVPPAAPDSLFVLVVHSNGSIGAGAGLAPTIELGAGAVCILSSVQNVNSVLDPKWLGADGTNILFVVSDGFDFSQVAVWTSVLAGLNLFNVPLALDGGTGTTAYRPVGVFGPLRRGTRYYDTTLVPPREIFWDGAQWTDALGVGPV